MLNFSRILLALLVLVLLSSVSYAQAPAQVRVQPELKACEIIDKAGKKFEFRDLFVNIDRLNLDQPSDDLQIKLPAINNPAYPSFKAGLRAYQERDFSKAAAGFLEAVKIDPTYTVAYYNLWVNVRRLAPAVYETTAQFYLSELGKLSQTHPNLPHPYWAQSFFHNPQAKNYNQAAHKELLDKALQLDAKFGPAWYELYQSEGDLAHLRKATLYSRQFYLPALTFILKGNSKIAFTSEQSEIEIAKAEEVGFATYIEEEVPESEKEFAGAQAFRLAMMYFHWTERRGGEKFLASYTKKILEITDLLIKKYPDSYWTDFAYQLQMVSYIFNNENDKILELIRQINNSRPDWLERSSWSLQLTIFLGLFMQNRVAESLLFYHNILYQLPLEFDYSTQNFILSVFLGFENLNNPALAEAEILFAIGLFAMRKDNYSEAWKAFVTAYRQALSVNNESYRKVAANNLAVMLMLDGLSLKKPEAGLQNRDLSILGFREVVKRGMRLEADLQILELKSWFQAINYLVYLEDYECAMAALNSVPIDLTEVEKENPKQTNQLLTLYSQYYRQASLVWFALGDYERASFYIEKGLNLPNLELFALEDKLALYNLKVELELQKIQQTYSSQESKALSFKTVQDTINAARKFCEFDQLSVLLQRADLLTHCGRLILSNVLLELDKPQPDFSIAYSQLEMATRLIQPSSQIEVRKIDPLEIEETRAMIQIKSEYLLEAEAVYSKLISFYDEIGKDDIVDNRKRAFLYKQLGQVYQDWANTTGFADVRAEKLMLAQESYSISISFTENVFNSAITNESLQQRYAATNYTAYENLIQMYMEKGATVDALRISERFKNWLTQKDFGRQGQYKLLKKANPDQLSRLLNLEQQLYKITAAKSSGKSPIGEADKVQLPSEQSVIVEHEKILLEINQLSNLPGSENSGLNLLQAIQEELKPGHFVLNYHLTSNVSYVWVISSAGLKTYRLPLDQKTIPALVDWRKRATLNGTIDEKETEEFYNQFFAPLAPDLTEAKLLTIVPDRQLNYLPFQLLREPASGKYLIEKYPLAYNVSLFELYKQLKDSSLVAPPKALVVTNPSPISRSLSKYQPMDELVNLFFWEGKVLSRNKATVEAVKELASAYNILQISTHGVSPNNLPAYFSYLELAGTPENTLQTDLVGTPLNALQIADLPLENTELVILSSCTTVNNSKIAPGTEFNNLNIAFLNGAGSKSVVYSLWEVDPEPTGILLLYFHSYLKAGYSKAEALQKAQISMLTRSEWKSPYFWAAFNFGGNPRPIN